MQRFEIGSLFAYRSEAAHYQELIREQMLSAGVYLLPAGSVDPQRPHTEDEVYYVVSGRGWIRVGDEDQPVTAGTLIFVPAGVEHRFHSITEQLVVLVLFAPAEGTASVGR